ncbi:MAG: hypothetical protein DRJ42_29520 [Deltaproteobacteria bacterium]|nr:MAG: hypothetical protein DRJ42_29520 [Deltaproteobacteria bacterium]
MALRFVSRALGAALVVVIGCGDDPSAPDSGAPDGELDSGSDSGVPGPNIPWLAEGVPPIMLAPCPEGWREVTVNGVSECDPYPEAGPATCEAGEAHFPGESGCRPIGEACPTGDYADSLPTPPPTDGSVIYVKAGAAAGGDGSYAMPYGALSEIRWTWLSPGATVALAKGTYEGTLHVKEGVRIVGACVRETRVTGDTDPDSSVATTINGVGEARVENLTIGGAAQEGLRTTGGHSITLEGVLVERTRGVGIAIANPDSVVTLRDAVIRDTQPRAGDDGFGQGINIQSGAQLSATRLLVQSNRTTGILAAHDATTVNLTDSVVRDTQPQASDGGFGTGIAIQYGAQLSATRLLVQGNHGGGVFANGDGTAVNLADTIIRDTASRANDGLFGNGIELQDGAQLFAARLVIRGNRSGGIFADGDGTAVDLTDTVVRDTAPRTSDDKFGRGIGIQSGAQLTAVRVLVEGNHEIGISLNRDATAVGLSDIVVRDTRPRVSDDSLGRGIHVDYGSRLEGNRLVIEDSHELGVAATEGADVDLRDVSISGVARAACASTTCPEDFHGHAVIAIGAAVRLTRFQIHDADTCGVFVAAGEASSPPAALDLESGTVSASEIGACIQVDGYDTTRLTNDVEYRDNGTNLDTTTLPLPEPPDSITP